MSELHLSSATIFLSTLQLLVIQFVEGMPVPEDLSAAIPYQDKMDIFTSAYINVSRESENSWVWDRTEVGRYGGGFVGPASGVLIHVTSDDGLPENSKEKDHTACKLPLRSSKGDKKLPPPGEPWIALIKRGKCSFEVKVENAFKSNAAGVLVYNDRDSVELDKMKLSTDNGRNISAVFTYKWKGEELARLIDNNSKVLVHITIAGHKPSRTATINRTSVLFVSITFIVLMIISLAWLVFYYVQRFRYIHAKDRLSKRLCNAAKKALSKIPTKNIKVEDREMQGDGECCAICIEPYRVAEVLRILPCSHEFHKSCIDPWLLEHRTCPMCKMDILKHYGFVFTGSQESILHMEIEEVVGLDSTNDSPRRNGGGISPLPQIRPVTNDLQRAYGLTLESEDNSSRSSSPNEMTPSLSVSNRQMLPVRQDLCVSCIAAAAAAALASQNDATKESHIRNENSTCSSNSDSGQLGNVASSSSEADPGQCLDANNKVQ